jgi:cobalt transporter subunit CbtB
MSGTLRITATTQAASLTRKAGILVQAALAILLGALVIGVAGFSQLEVVHNAAHDTRHANGFPCH